MFGKDIEFPKVLQYMHVDRVQSMSFRVLLARIAAFGHSVECIVLTLIQMNMDVEKAVYTEL